MFGIRKQSQPARKLVFGYCKIFSSGESRSCLLFPCKMEKEEEVCLYVAENAGLAKNATLKLLFEELTEIPEIYFNGQKIGGFTAEPYRDLQVTTEKEAPNSGYGVSIRLAKGIDLSKPCTLLTADLTGVDTKIGYNTIRVITKTPVSLEKVELEVRR